MKPKERHLQSVTNWIRFFLSVCSGLMFFINFSATPKIESFTLAEMLSVLINDFSGKQIQISLLILLFYLASRVRIPVRYSLPLFYSLTGLITVIWLAAEGFRLNGKLSGIFTSPILQIKAFIYGIGAFFVILQGYRMLIFLIAAGPSRNDPVPSGIRTWLSVFLGLLTFWAVPILISYPANMTNDIWSELAQYWGLDQFSSYHPPFFTFITGTFSRIGRVFGNINNGLFLFVIFQALLYAGIIGYTFILLRSMRVPGWLCGLYFLSAVLSPYYANFVDVILKDSFYSIFYLLFTTELVYALRDPEQFFKDRRHLILSSISVSLVILSRKNGLPLIILFLAFLLVTLCIIHKTGRTSGKILLYTLVLFGTSLIFSAAVEKAIMTAYNGVPGPVREALCLPFQQTARFVRAYGNEVTDEEKEAIDAVLNYNVLADVYDPITADPVKATFRWNASTEDVLRYLRTWAGMFFRHPIVYLSATLHQNYFLFYPQTANVKSYTTYETGWVMQVRLFNSNLGFSASETTLSQYRETMKSIWVFLSKMPISGVLAHPAINILIQLGLFVWAVQKKDLKPVIVCVPNLLSIFAVIMSPYASNGARYCFPIIYSIPVLLGYCISR